MDLLFKASNCTFLWCSKCDYFTVDTAHLVWTPTCWLLSQARGVCLLRGGPGRTLITPTIVPEYPGSDSCERICIKFTPRWGSYIVRACVHAKSLQWCLTLCSSVDYSPPGFFVHEILQARILKWVAISSSGDLPDPGTGICCTGRRVLYH